MKMMSTFVRKIVLFCKRKDIASMGIGAMIIFISLTLVAGIAATVVVQTANELQSRALQTGKETINEVSTGVHVVNVEGYTTTASNGLDKLAIAVSPRAGAEDVDLNQTAIGLSVSDSDMMIFRYDSANFNSSASDSGVFATDAFNLTATQFGIIVLEDADGSCKSDTPTINKGDTAILTINASAAFSPGIGTRKDVWGNVMPEFGSWGLINFNTPTSYPSSMKVHDLQ